MNQTIFGCHILESIFASFSIASLFVVLHLKTLTIAINPKNSHLYTNPLDPSATSTALAQKNLGVYASTTIKRTFSQNVRFLCFKTPL
jgi:hypothetical protein